MKPVGNYAYSIAFSDVTTRASSRSTCCEPWTGSLIHARKSSRSEKGLQVVGRLLVAAPTCITGGRQ